MSVIDLCVCVQSVNHVTDRLIATTAAERDILLRTRQAITDSMTTSSPLSLSISLSPS